MKVVPFRQLCV